MKNRFVAFMLAGVLSLSLVGTALATSLTPPPSGSSEKNPNGGISIDNPTATPTPPPYIPPTNPTTPTNPSYNVTDGSGTAENGSWTSDKTSAKKGDTVTVTTTPKEGYEAVVTVKDSKGNEVEVKDLGDGKFSYVMPDSAVTVSVEFKPVVANPFTDVAEGAYYYDAVLWAVEKGITNGKTDTSFAPGDPCTRAQIVTFLWRAYGEPEPTNTTNPFTDVKESDYFYTAVLWAVENGITNGTNAEGTLFSPGKTCTRAQAVTFQYRAAKAEPVEGGNKFTDVANDAYYAEAVDWAVANDITNGTGNDRFSPNNTCNRGQIVTFLYRELGEK